MHRRCCLVVLVLVSVSPGVRGDDPKAEPTVERLIEQLADPSFPVRQAAAQAIEARGTAALPALRQAQAHPDLEVRRRIEQWLPGLERAAVLEPKRVTLNLTQRPVREAFEAMAKQTGFKIDLSQNPEREKQLHSVRLEQVPFWDAFDKLAEESGVVLQPSYGDDTLRLQFQDNYTPYVHRNGPFRIIAQGFEYGRTIQFGSLPRAPRPFGGPEAEYLRFNFSIGVEPRLPLLGTGEAKLIEATDERKQSLLPAARGEADGRVFRRVSHYWGGYRTYTISAQANLTAPLSGARTLKVLRGTLPVTLLAEQKTLVVTDAVLTAKGKKFKAGGVSIDVQDVRETGDKRYEIKMSIQPEGKADVGDTNWINTLYSRLELQDAKGTKYGLYGSSMQHNNNSAQVTFTYGRNGNAGAPAKLVYQHWVTLQHEVAFEFRDLPLP